MTQFDDREQAFENKFGHEGELEFKIASRMARLFGRWVAQQMGLKGQEAESYADKAVDIELAKSGRTQLIAKAEKDFKDKGIAVSYHLMEREMESCYVKAREELSK